MSEHWSVDTEKFLKLGQELDNEFDNVMWPMLEAMGFEIPMED